MQQDRVLAGRFFVPDSLDENRGLDRILIRNLMLKAMIGIHAHEKLAPQRVLVNVDLRVHMQSGPIGDDIENVISYEHLVNGIKDIVAKGHINLVESLAESVGDLCLRDARAVEVTVRVEKPDIEPDAEAVGVEIHRRRPVSPPAAIYRLPADKRGPEKT